MPPALAFSVTVWLVVTEASGAVKDAVVAPAKTVRLEGTVAAGLSRESATGNPPLEADLLIVTTQEDNPGPVTVAGEQLRPLNTAGATRLTVAMMLCPFQAAVMVA